MRRKKKSSGTMRDGISDYLADATIDFPVIPRRFQVAFRGETEAVDWAIQWLPEGGEVVAESYVNLIPTPQGGTHVNGLRSGLLDAMREFCELRNLLPRGVKLTAEDVGPVLLRAVIEVAGPTVLGPNKPPLFP